MGRHKKKQNMDYAVWGEHCKCPKEGDKVTIETKTIWPAVGIAFLLFIFFAGGNMAAIVAWGMGRFIGGHVAPPIDFSWAFLMSIIPAIIATILFCSANEDILLGEKTLTIKKIKGDTNGK